MRRTETPKPIWTNFCTMVDMSDIVTYTYFGDHRLRGFWVAGVSAVAFLKNKKVAESLCAEGREITHAQNRNP